MKRITAEEVIAAYKHFGFTSCRKHFFREPSQACAAGILAMKRAEGTNVRRIAWNEFPHFLGVTEPYMRGFVIGFDDLTLDGLPAVYLNSTEVTLGFEDGIAVAKAVREAGY